MFGDAGDDLYGGPESDSLSGGWGSDSKSQNGNSGASCDCETAACDKPEPQPPAHADFGDAPDSLRNDAFRQRCQPHRSRTALRLSRRRIEWDA